MQMQYDYGKFREWLLLKRYSPYTIETTVRVVEYFRGWSEQESIGGLEEISYQDAMGFMSWSSKRGASQKTICNYVGHLRKFYAFLISEAIISEDPVSHIKVQGIKRRVCHDILEGEVLQQLYDGYPVEIVYEAGKNIPPQQRNTLSRRRNKVILGLLVYQGLRMEEVAALHVQDLQLREGKITIHSGRKTAARVLPLESHQVYELMDYVHEVRKAFLQAGGASGKLFIQWNSGENFHCINQPLLAHLKKINSRVKSLEQIRASVITGWLRAYDLRKVQYLAGHKYVSSTEAYKVNLLDELQDDIAQYHPL